MGKKKFNKRQSVRYSLVPGKDQNGNPLNLFKPLDNNSRLSDREKKQLTKGFEDYQIEIDGKIITDQSQIPAYILQQIRGRGDLVYNQKHPEMLQEQEQGLIFEDQEEQMEQWEDEEQMYETGPSKKEQEQKQQFIHEGKTYMLTKKQIQMLEQVLPQDYQTYIIEGVQFNKFDDDGNLLDKKMEFKKYMAEPEEKRATIDSYEFVPEKPLVVYDNDLKEDQIKGEMKDIEDALNYEGDDQAYQQIEDDFFAKLLEPSNQKKQKKPESQTQSSFKKKKNAVEFVNEKKAQQKEIKKPIVDSKWDDIDEEEYQLDDEQFEDQDIIEQEEITDQMVDQAIQEFDRLADMKQQNGQGLTGLSLINFIQSREECIGRDGELDWRTLTKKQKKEYMKNKKIRSFLEELRQREIAQKMRGIKNVDPESLHLKHYIGKLDYNEDHVIQDSIKRDAQKVVDMDKQDSEDFETDSQEDDIISYRAKTSIISSNLATVEEFGKKKKKKERKQSEQSSNLGIENIEKVKVVPEKRNKNETKEQRKARKQKLKQMKKNKRQQKNQFNQLFEGQRKKVLKTNTVSKDVLHKVSYVKIA